MRASDHGLGPLADGRTAVVIGGGPGGVAAAIALKKGARELRREVRTIIVEGKQFAGEQHHNQCTGVLSPPIVELLEKDLAVSFPRHLVQRTITGYVLHADRRRIVLDGENDAAERGAGLHAPAHPGGPEWSMAVRRVQFDAYMLEAARECGIEVLHARVTGLEFHAGRVVIYTDSSPLAADVVVGAFGLDEGTATVFHRAVGYRPPPALCSVVTKLHPGESFMAGFGDRIHAFLPSRPRIDFGAVTPKGNHLTINIAGKSVDSNLMDRFLSYLEVRGVLRDVLPHPANAGPVYPNDLVYFKGRLPCGLARRYTGDRFVMVGDAAGLVRAFKGKGVTSAIQTGIRAAHVILTKGISADAFRSYHAANREILEDLPYGRAMRLLTILASRFSLIDIALAAAETEAGLRRALFDSVSAHRPYRDVIRRGLSPASLLEIAKSLTRGWR